MNETFDSILVTGGAGFIGSNFVHFVADNHPNTFITVLDNLTYAGNIENLHGIPENRLKFVRGDVCDSKVVDDLVSEVDAVVNFAAESHNDNAIAQPAPFIRTNIVGTFNLLEAVRKHDKRFHHISTDEVFGDLPLDKAIKFNEHTPYDPSSPYSATKASSDMLVKAWNSTYGTKTTISNCSNNYGSRQHIEKFIPRQITNILSGIKPKLYGDGMNVRDWIHVEDHCNAVWEILINGEFGETYLIGSNCEMSNREVLNTILSMMDKPNDWFDFVQDRPAHDRRNAVDAAYFEKSLDWSPKHSNFEDGLKSTIDWYADNQNWWRKSKQQVEERYKIQAESSN